MKKKLAAVGLGVLLASSIGYASPFTKTTGVKLDTSVSSSSVESASDVSVTDNKTADDKTAAQPTENKTSTYTVQIGDYLSLIAQNLLGDSSRWPEIVELNKDKYPSLLSNPNLIYEGWVLTIPGGSSSSNANNTIASNNSSNNSNPGNENTTYSSSNSSTNVAIAPSASDNANVSSGRAPKRSVDSPSGAPALQYQSAPSGSCINTKSPSFRSWFDSALDTYGNWDMPAVKNKYGQTVSVEMFMKAIMLIETNGTHRNSGGKLVTSCCGAQGFMQLMPATAKGLGVDATDPKQNIAGGCKLFQQIFTSTYVGKKSGVDKLVLAACAYNAGPWSKLVKGSWQDLKNSGSSVQSYGIKFKMGVGLALTADEIAYAQKHMTGGQNVEAYAANIYARAQGFGL